MTKIKVGGRELALAFTIGAMDAMERTSGKPVDLENVKESIVEMLKDRRSLISLLVILAREGEELEGRTLDVDEEWFKKHMRPGALPKVQVAVLDAVADGMRMEAAEGEEDEEVDVVLEEIKKKQEQTA